MTMGTSACMPLVKTSTGAAVACVGRSPLGDPGAYRIREAVIAIRDRDARGVLLAAR